MDKQRIISHMNKDHQLALVDYTVVYGHEQLSKFRPETVQMIDTDEESLTLSYKTQDGATKNLVIIWNDAKDGQGLKVSAMLDVKAKLIAMAKYAAEKQGFSHKRITTILWPKGAISYSMYAFAALFFALSAKKSLIGRLFGLYLSANSVALAEKYIIPFTATLYGIHIAEMLFVVLPLTIKHRMPQKAQIAYLAMNFFEGFFVPQRVKKLAE